MNRFKIFDTTADVGIIASGDSMESLFENAAAGMFNL
ncbi:archease, partial [bacterium]|nr:archease [bacterium]